MTKSAYQQIADDLRRQIADGRWKPGERLPGELELGKLFGVSRNTVRQALHVLTQVNLLRRQRGSGTYVSEQGMTHTLGDLRSFTDLMRDLGLKPGIRDIAIHPDPSPPLNATDFLPGAHLWRVSRLRLNDDRPFCLMVSWVPDEIGAQLEAAELARTQSLYALFAERGVYVKEASEKIRAEAATPDQAAALGVAAGFPLLTINRWTSDTSGRPVEYVSSSSPGDRYEYFVKLTQ
ncbi:GntR family transcriptional regulator [Microbacterium sp. JAI119]|uniref:GntR family transcriptional regulator n=1 Tax=Microbacterium sp. JAI119 TaxID=2723062 RepID=UPI0015CCFEA5|nr:GntR family transcriptional regulator [Microbacterium sp. JAI119]NYF28096.1 GntR family transcriptional regulator [Microbacterium sp. JAI119]